MDDPLIEPILDESVRRGWLDDQAAAKLLATHLADQGYAWNAVAERLLKKGFDAQLVRQLLRPLKRHADEAERARVVVAARLRGRSAHDPRLRTQLARALARRGFDSDLIERVLADALGSPPDEP